jgi:hypothetical protein
MLGLTLGVLEGDPDELWVFVTGGVDEGVEPGDGVPVSVTDLDPVFVEDGVIVWLVVPVTGGVPEAVIEGVFEGVVVAVVVCVPETEGVLVGVSNPVCVPVLVCDGVLVRVLVCEPV